MTMTPEEKDESIGTMMRVISDTITEEMPGVGFLLILGRSSEGDEEGSLMSMTNLGDEDLTGVLEAVLARRRNQTAQNASSTRTVQ